MIITLCGSARFESHFHLWNKLLTLGGHTVFSLAAYPSIESGKDWYDESTKKLLDAAHFRKIDASEGILVLNRLAYIGDSTLREIMYARRTGKTLYFLESWGQNIGINSGGCSHTKELTEKCLRYGLESYTQSPIRTCDDMSALNLLDHVPFGALRSEMLRAATKVQSNE
jgi:hypothetical protein